MVEQTRNDRGKFEPKGDEPRMVHSIRLPDSIWLKVRQTATDSGVTTTEIVDRALAAALSPSPQLPADTISLEHLDRVLNAVASDRTVTRNGKDGGAVRKTIAAIKARLG